MRDEARPLLEDMRSIGDATRGEALLSVAAEDRDRLYDTLTLMKSNLVQACRLGAGDKEKNHG
jgi:hypothetical protein